MDPRRGLVDCNGQSPSWGYRLEPGESDCDCDGCVVAGSVVAVFGVRDACAVVRAPGADVLIATGLYGFKRMVIDNLTGSPEELLMVSLQEELSKAAAAAICGSDIVDVGGSGYRSPTGGRRANVVSGSQSTQPHHGRASCR